MRKLKKKRRSYKSKVDALASQRSNEEISKVAISQQETVKKLRQKQCYLAKKNKERTREMSNTNLTYFVNKVLKCMHFEKHTALVLEIVMSGEMFGEAGQSVGKDFIAKEVRKVITAWHLCKTCDTAHQGCLNLQGIKAVQQSQELEKGEEGFIHSKLAVWREGRPA